MPGPLNGSGTRHRSCLARGQCYNVTGTQKRAARGKNSRADDVLNLEFREFCLKAKLLDNSRILAARQPTVIFRLGTSDDHLAAREQQSSCTRLANPHNDCGESLWERALRQPE